MKRFCSLCLLLILALPELRAQVTFPSNGAFYQPHTLFAITGATVYLDYETVLNDAVLLVRDGRVVEVGHDLKIPQGAFVINAKGKFIYPSFIDLYSEYGLALPKKEKKGPGPQMESNQKGAYGWNQAIRPSVESHKVFAHDQEAATDLRKAGFGAVVSCVKDGIVRGSGVLVQLAKARENESILIDRAAGFYSFHKGSSTQDYPTSLTGGIALLRQTYYDAAWYAQDKNRKEYNISLEDFNRLQTIPSVFEGNDKYTDLRAATVGREFGVSYIIKAGGNEYQRIHEIRASGLRYIVPLNFPQPFDVEDVYAADAVTLTELKHWELAPTNPAAFERHMITFAFTAYGLKNRSEFLSSLRKATRYGLSEKTALKALTYNPALFINAADRLGSLKKGYLANFIICSAPLFSDNCSILQNWVGGVPEVYAELEVPDIRGNYEMRFGSGSYQLGFTGDPAKPRARLKADTSQREFVYTFANGSINFSFMPDTVNMLQGTAAYDQKGRRFSGSLRMPDGTWQNVTITYLSPVDTASKPVAAASPLKDLGKVIYPFTAYGEPLPEDEKIFRDAWDRFRDRYSAILIKDATVWTNTKDSVLEGYDVYIVEGKVVRVAPEIDAPKLAFAKVINGKGMHLTPGIIDEHSHIAISAGVNEAGQASSAEVRMGDVINPEDINIYRQLAGGVTSAQLLHGSANPIGGQSVLIKLRWGHGAEELKFEKADPFIKFALGENVKQSNWGDHNNVRFPQSRMGVEQVYRDYFSRALAYSRQQQDKKNPPPRRDLELDALAEILQGKRFITCHSYVQSEINMLMHVADSFGFKVNTFTHILEGYKVADKMKRHGANASTFSDWWAYKNEVLDAIPYNAALLTRAGVNTAINSDDAEMGRRLNQEAGKMVKYGRLTEVQALRLVTLNPAIMLHIDKQVGTIEPGKVADLVLWTDHPLSIYARARYTIIDGKIYFDAEEDEKLKEYNRREKARLIAKMLAEKKKGAATVKPRPKSPKLYHCNTIEGISEEETGKR